MAAQIIQQYLATPPYLGRSTFADKAFVKDACGATCCFDERKKMWGTQQIDCLIRLVRSRKFQPFGIEPGWNTDLVDAAHAYAAEAERAWVAQNAAPTPDPPKDAPQPPPKKPPRALTGPRREARPVCKAAKKLIAKPNPRNQGKLVFKSTPKPQAA